MSYSENNYLDETRKNLVQEIASLREDEFNGKPDKEMWSIAQVCHHLVLVEKATAKVINWGIKEPLSTNIERRKVDLILDRTKKIKAPKVVEPDEQPFAVQQMIDLLNDSRTKLRTVLRSIEDKSILEEKSVNHPAFGELPLDQWVDLIPLHEQRHIEQIKEIKSILGIMD
jgi:uncharacterized damage-inducible protein DinB